ncbi:MAG: hypothetical protein ABI323_08510 [Solirubrobacteraceae bacterium]
MLAGKHFSNEVLGRRDLRAGYLVGFDYHHPSAEGAWRRIFVFFDEHLASEA